MGLCQNKLTNRRRQDSNPRPCRSEIRVLNRYAVLCLRNRVSRKLLWAGKGVVSGATVTHKVSSLGTLTTSHLPVRWGVGVCDTHSERFTLHDFPCRIQWDRSRRHREPPIAEGDAAGGIEPTLVCTMPQLTNQEAMDAHTAVVSLDTPPSCSHAAAGLEPR